MLKPILTALILGAPLAANAGQFTIAALGDVPYGAPEKVFGPFESLIAEINANDPDLVIHVGDTKSGSSLCDDAMLDAQLGYLNDFKAPTIYTPGDNEWTDCYRKKAGKFDPLERLAYIRKNYFADPATTFGQTPAAVEFQSADYPENTRMMKDGVMIIAAHVVGSNNNFETRSADAVAEFFARSAANDAWLAESFDAAKDADAVILAIHADMFEFDFNMLGKERWLRHSGFNSFGPLLQEKAAEYGKPVLLVFGDSHVHRTFRPFPKTAPNVTAMEVYGSKDMHAVRIDVDTTRKGVFAISSILNPALN